MVAMTTRAGTRRHTPAARVVDCHHSPLEGRNAAACGPLGAVLLPPGQQLPAPGERARGRSLW